MTFNKFNPQPLLHFVNQHQRQLNLLVVVLLSLYLIAFAAQLVWRIIPEPAQSATPSVSNRQPVTNSGSQSGVNIRQLQQLNLFGDAKAVAKPVETNVTDAPETRLNLTLAGVVASSSEQEGTAIIENRGAQETYGIGDKITGTNAVLERVMVDRVILKNGIQHETLMLEGLDFDEANRNRMRKQNIAVNPQVKRPSTQERPRTLSDDALEATEAMRRQPASFTDYIAVTPKTGEDGLVGYEVKPGKDPSLFQSAGLKAGDVVIQINGLDLTDSQQSLEAMGELRSAQSIELTLLRDGDYETIYLEMPEAPAE